MIHLHKGVSTGTARYGGFKSGVWATLLAVRNLFRITGGRQHLIRDSIVCLSRYGCTGNAAGGCRCGITGPACDGMFCYGGYQLWC